MREALKKAIETTIEDVGYAMAYTKKARVISGSSRAGYLHDTLAKKYYDDLDVEVGKKVDDLIPLVKRIYKTHIGDFGRRELVEASKIYGHIAYDQESTEELRNFVQKKLEEGNQFSDKLIYRYFSK